MADANATETNISKDVKQNIHIRFPDTLGSSTHTSAMLFQASAWNKARKADMKNGESNYDYSKQPKGSVALYLPVISEGHSVTWDKSTPGTTSVTQIFREKLLEAIPIGGEAISDHIKLSTGTSVSQDAIATFQDVSNRQFTFTYELIPSSAEEAANIKKIIDFFRYNSLPNFSPSLIHFPSIFHIFVLGMKENTIQFKPAALINMKVTYGGNGSFMQLTTDGQPLKVQLDLEFEEVTKPYKNDFEYSDFEYSDSKYKKG